MESPDSGERAQRPELEGVEPSRLFLVAKNREQWIRERVSQQQLPMAIDHFIEELERYVTERFDGTLPELTIVSPDVTQTIGLHALNATDIRIESGTRPFEGDEELLKTHTIQGRLFGFHRGVTNDLRVYVDNDEPPHSLPGGIYNGYYSVSVQNAEIRLSDELQNEEALRHNEYLDQLLSGYDTKVNRLYGALLRELPPRHRTTGEYRPAAHILQQCSSILADIEAHPDVKPQLTDALLDYITFVLGLESPRTIDVIDHRIVISSSGYDRGGPAVFEDVELRLCMMGETRSRMLGVFFSAKDDDQNQKTHHRTIQVPVQSIKSIKPREMK